MKKIQPLIHKVNPYDDLISRVDDQETSTAVHVPQVPDFQGWGGHSDYFLSMIEKVKPSTIVEVGSWKGKSAIAMAGAVKYYNLDTEIVCVDTWLGADEFWDKFEDKNRYESLKLYHGYPTVYYTFLSNVERLGFDSIITPFPQPSVAASRFFKRKNLSAQLIYIDGSHEYEDVADDIKNWWEVLSDGGIMCGDDYCEKWSGVMDAVQEFAYYNDLQIKTASYDNEGGWKSVYWSLSEKKDFDIPF